jgi:predicted CXXCH cytochrome family protein
VTFGARKLFNELLASRKILRSRYSGSWKRARPSCERQAAGHRPEGSAGGRIRKSRPEGRSRKRSGIRRIALISSRAMSRFQSFLRPACIGSMPSRRRGNVASILLLLLGGSLLASRAAFAQEGCTSEACHATLLKAKVVHPATESCESCHEAVASPHPQKGKKTFKLTEQPPALCAACHEPAGKKSQVHPPVKEGMCTTCHDPHASNEPKLLLDSVASLCTSCHSEVTTAKLLHAPVAAGDCLACHAAHESDSRPLLRAEGETLCFQCHGDIQALLKKKDVHPAMEAGCTACHNPHGAAHPKLLAEEGAQLCFQCHDAIGSKIEKGPTVHAAVKEGKGCINCHAAHAADGEHLLEGPQEGTCVMCHRTVMTKNMTVMHGPIRQGQCTPCHDPHAGAYPRLVVAEFPAGFYAPYTEQEYALCFGCHKREMVQVPDTTVATGFRDGERNLHFLHVNNKQKGRSCRACHAVHGSVSPKLIAESVLFGKWNLPIRFVKTETGGSCAPGCHRPVTYDRKNPARKPLPSSTATKKTS